MKLCAVDELNNHVKDNSPICIKSFKKYYLNSVHAISKHQTILTNHVVVELLK
jgi:hypothetical protein